MARRLRRRSSSGAGRSASRRSASPDCDLSAAEPRLLEWLARGWHGEMDYMARHGARRARPDALVPGTLRVISCRMDYLPSGEEAGGSRARGHRALRARARLPQGPAQPAAALVRAHRRASRRLRLPRVLRFGAGDGGRTGGEGRPRLARQAHAAAVARSRLVVLSRRNLHRSAAAGRCAAQRALRHLRTPASTPARPGRSSRPTSSMRGAASPTSRSSTRARSPKNCGR